MTQAYINAVKREADIVCVIRESTPLTWSGTSYKGLCPFHGEKTPSFHVRRGYGHNHGFFHCFGCGAGGDVIKFVERQEHMGFEDAVRLLAQRFGLQMPEPEA